MPTGGVGTPGCAALLLLGSLHAMAAAARRLDSMSASSSADDQLAAKGKENRGMRQSSMGLGKFRVVLTYARQEALTQHLRPYQGSFKMKKEREQRHGLINVG